MTIEQQIRHYIAENFLFGDDGFELVDDVSFLDKGIMDSTGILELVMFVEEDFGFAVQNDEIVPKNFESVASLAAYIRAKGAS